MVDGPVRHRSWTWWLDPRTGRMIHQPEAEAPGPEFRAATAEEIERVAKGWEEVE